MRSGLVTDPVGYLRVKPVQCRGESDKPATPGNIMKKSNQHILFFTFLLILAGPWNPVSAQQVNFGTFAEGYELTLTPLVPDELNFGDRNSGEGIVQVQLQDNETVPIEIEGVAYLDVTVTLEPPQGDQLVLMGDAENLNDESSSMPVSIRMAYYNRGQEGITEGQAKTEAVEVVGNTATFQIRRRPGGPPGPPPVPPHAGYIPPKAKAYLYIYGDLTVGNVNAGPYSGTINVHVEYSTYMQE